MMEPWDAVFSWRGPTFAAVVMFIKALAGWLAGVSGAIYGNDIGVALGFTLGAFLYAAIDRSRKHK